MKKLNVIIFSFCIALAANGFAYGQTNQPNSTAKTEKKTAGQKKSRGWQKQKPSFACDLPASVTNVELSQTEIALSCPTGENCSDNKIIKVKTVAVDSGEIKYVYTVSAGKIIGEGANVEWDLSDAKPGSYTITTGISQPIFGGERWEIFGKTMTKVVVIKE